MESQQCEYKLHVSNIEKSCTKWLNFGKSLIQMSKDTISGVHISQGIGRWENKTLFDSVLSQQHSPKIVKIG